MARVVRIHLAELMLSTDFRAHSALRSQARRMIGESQIDLPRYSNQRPIEGKTMLRKISAALIAATLSGAPAFAQSTMIATRAPATQPAKIPALKTIKMSAKPTVAKVHKASKIGKIKKHKVKKQKLVKMSKPMLPKKHIVGKPTTRAQHN
jgi:hypothetical protein